MIPSHIIHIKGNVGGAGGKQQTEVALSQRIELRLDLQNRL